MRLLGAHLEVHMLSKAVRDLPSSHRLSHAASRLGEEAAASATELGIGSLAEVATTQSKTFTRGHARGSGACSLRIGGRL